MLITTAALSAARSLTAGRYLPTWRSFAMTSIVAGAMWPLVLLGVAELGSVITVAKLRQA